LPEKKKIIYVYFQYFIQFWIVIFTAFHLYVLKYPFSPANDIAFATEFEKTCAAIFTFILEVPSTKR